MRRQGFAVGVQETLDALRLATTDALWDEPIMRDGLRSLLCQSRDEWLRFDPLFEQFWYPRRLAQAAQSRRRDPRMPRDTRAAGVTGLGHTAADESAAASDNDVRGGGAGRQKALARSDFRFLTERAEMLAMAQLAERLAKLMRQRLTRRDRNLKRGKKIHLRRTLRNSLAYGGLPLVPAYRERKRQWPRLVLMLDISHSMARYSELLARFVRGLVLRLPEAEAFLFHTRLHRVTDLFRQTDVDTLRKRLERLAPLWMGGTRIADSLNQFNRLYNRRLVTSRSIVIIMSDGFDSDHPALLVEELRLLRKRAQRVLWLNPMLGWDDHDPDEGVLQAVRPLLDLLAPAHSVASLEAVVGYLGAL
jgi:uncharacterized protein with von Willebrand factor type A (vWA) domain